MTIVIRYNKIDKIGNACAISFAISEWLCSLSSQLFPLNYFTPFVLRAQ